LLRILYLTDTHIRAYSPISRRDNFQETIFAKLAEVVQLASKYAVDLVLHGGDLFDIPQVSHRLTGRTAELFRSFPCPVWVVPGNHDLFGSLSTMEYTSLGVLARAGVVRLLTEDTEFAADGISLRIRPIPASREIPALAYVFSEPALPGQYRLIVAHDNLVLNPVHPDIPHKVISPEISNADLVLAGHWHPGWPDVVDSGNTSYVNPGSLARVDAGKFSRDRQIRVVLLAVVEDGIFIDFIPLEMAKPFSEVFTDDCRSTDRAISLVPPEPAADLANTIVDVFTLLEQSDADQAVKELITNTAATLPHYKAVDLSWTNEPLRLVKLSVTGFQSHMNTEVEFSPGLNVIVGPNGSGKSALLRALWWLCYDEPKGARLMNANSDRQIVSATFSNSSRLLRKRTRTNAGSYEIERPGREPAVLAGIGHRLPPEVIDIHKTPPVELAGESVILNIAGQFDPPFLIGYTNGTALALLDRLTNNDTASAVLKQLRSTLDQLKRRLAICMPQYEHLDDPIAATNQIAALAAPLKSLYDAYGACVDKFNHLVSMCDFAEQWNKLQVSAGRVLAAWDELSLEDRLAKAGRTLDLAEASLISYHSKLLPFITSYNNEAAGYQMALARLDLSRFAESYSQYRHLLASIEICPLCGGSFDCSDELAALDADYDSMDKYLEDVCNLEVQSLSLIDDSVIAQFKQVKQNYESCRSDVAGLLKVLEVYRNNILVLRQECISTFGVEPEELTEKIDALTKELLDSVDSLASSLASIKSDYQQLAEQAGMSI